MSISLTELREAVDPETRERIDACIARLENERSQPKDKPARQLFLIEYSENATYRSYVWADSIKDARERWENGPSRPPRIEPMNSEFQDIDYIEAVDPNDYDLFEADVVGSKYD